jgi:hypothetical protein
VAGGGWGVGVFGQTPSDSPECRDTRLALTGTSGGDLDGARLQVWHPQALGLAGN